MRIFISEEDRWKSKPLHEALVEAMRANDIAGVTVYRGILGYGAHRRIHKDKPLFASHHGSVMLSAIDTAPKSCAPSCPWSTRWSKRDWWSSPTWTSSSTPIAPSRRPLRALGIPRLRARRISRNVLTPVNTHQERGPMKEQFTARMLRIHFGEDDRWQGKPLHEAILAKCVEVGHRRGHRLPRHRGLRISQPDSPCPAIGLSKDAPIQMSVIGSPMSRSSA
jgi:PII-like signaling protein